MSWGEIISIILGSSVLSAIFGILYDIFSNKRKSKEKRREKLYSPLRFYLMLMEKNSNLRKELLKSRQEADKKADYRDPENKRMNKFTADNNELTISWWIYARKVIGLLETAPQYIKKEHWSLIETLFEYHIFRKVVSGEEMAKDDSWLYGDDIFEKESRNGFVLAMEELYKKISDGSSD
jgi:hypothetical protein